MRVTFPWSNAMKPVMNFILVILLCSIPAGLRSGERTFTIIHTNDMHSHVLGCCPNKDFTPERTGDDDTLGGFSRLATAIRMARAARQNPVFVIDAGDFLMGTLFHMLAREEAIELRLMKMMGYDMVTLGNHEFDLKPAGLARILRSAHARNGLPEVVASNISFSKTDARDDDLKRAFDEGLVRPWRVVEKNGVRFGFFGLMGKEAAEDSPFAKPVKFTAQVEAARGMVRELRGRQKADVVVLISHCGVWEKESHSEDVIIAKKVPGIDIIIGGHTHTKLDRPIIIGKTIIVQAGEMARWMGVIDFTVGKNGGVRLDRYALTAIDDTIPGDPAITAAIRDFIALIDRKVLAPEKVSFGTVIARTAFSMNRADDESTLGNLIADGVRWYLNKHHSDPSDPLSRVSIAIESNGLIRNHVARGKTGDIMFADFFNAFPLGIGMDDEQSMCYPLITLWVYPHEIKKALEVLTSIYPLKGTSYFLQVSGLKMKYNPRRMIFDRVTDIWIGDDEKGYTRLDYSTSNRKLYRIAANIYNAAFLKLVGDFTFGTLTIVPKDRNGKPIADLLAARVDADPGTPGIQEVKEWKTVLAYIRSMPDTNGDGVPDISGKYSVKQGRIVSQASMNPASLLSRPAPVTLVAAGACAGCAALIGCIVFFVVRRVRSRGKNA